ncbi:unnamed protein product [Timema podura]|uniref:Exportin-2 C-terminal domain-containing protein n=1 Tax=Timema podura TaxID=61482 RepID=A0ABN7P516_TIMPD|nr:unnamed protein product [Timema podura]
MVDSIQQQMFRMVLERLFLQDIQKISGPVEKKVTAVGVTKMLCECPQFVDGPYSNMWAPLLQALVSFFELPEDKSLHPDDHFVEVDDAPGYQPSYSQLAFASKKEHDPLYGVDRIPNPQETGKGREFIYSPRSGGIDPFPKKFWVGETKHSAVLEVTADSSLLISLVDILLCYLANLVAEMGRGLFYHL